MATTGARPGGAITRPPAENDVYTAMIVVAFLFILTATIYVGVRAYSFYGTLLPPPGS